MLCNTEQLAIGTSNRLEKVKKILKSLNYVVKACKYTMRNQNTNSDQLTDKLV